VYHNELFTEGDVLGGEEAAQGAPNAARPGSSQKMQQQRSTLAARRAERMQGNIYQSNDTGMGRMPGSPAPRPPAGQGGNPRSFAAEPSQNQQGYGYNERDSGQGRGQGNAGSVYGLASTFDPNEDQHQQPNRQVVPRAPVPAPIDLSDIRAFLMQPGPRNGPIMCYIVRDKGSAKMYPKYNLFLQDNKRFLLAARKRKKQTTSNYLVSLDYDDLDRDSPNYFGKLRANFVGTEFTIFDAGDKKNKKSGDDGRAELGCVTYQYNVLGTRGPRKMTGVIPALDSSGRCLYHPQGEEDAMLERLKANRGLDELVIMRNKPPRWNEELNAYCLNFNGRVTEASVKNFQLVTDDNQSHVILQFGKIGKNTFTMDYQWPINAFQAFSICLSSFDNKLACE